MSGRRAGLCLAHALDMDEKHISFKLIPNPYAKTLTNADLTVVIVADAKPESWSDLKNDNVELMDISEIFSFLMYNTNF